MTATCEGVVTRESAGGTATMEPVQLTLDDAAPPKPLDCGSLMLARAHATKHPEVYRAIVEECRRQLAASKTGRIGIKAVVEALRWSGGIRRPKGDPYLVNNNCSSGYARLVMEREADLADAFELRKVK